MHESAPTTQWIDTTDKVALNALIDRCLPWIQGAVRSRLGAKLREKAESGDIVQDALLRFVRYCPRLGVVDERGFCALMARIVENAIRDHAGMLQAQRRDVGREVAGAEASAVFAILAREDGTPSRILGDQEGARVANFALGLLGATDRFIILGRLEDRSHRELAEELGISEDASVSRHRRAQMRLVQVVKRLEQGLIPDLEVLVDASEVDQEPFL